MSVYNPERAVVGSCPDCARPVVVVNDYGTWDLATCPCGWRGGIDQLDQAVVYRRGEHPETI